MPERGSHDVALEGVRCCGASREDWDPRLELTRSFVAAKAASGISWGSVLAIVVLVLLAGAFFGNLFASKRRRSRVSVYATIRHRVDQDAASGATPHATEEPPRHRVWAELADAVGEEPPVEVGGDVWQRLSELVDPAEFRPRLAPDVEVKEFKLRWGNDYAMAANPRDLLHYRLEPDEVELLALMDGTHSVKDIVVERFQDSGDMEISGVADLVRQLRVGNFLDTPFVDVDEQVRHAMDPVSSLRAKARNFVKTLSFEWTGAHLMVAWFYRHGVKWFFNKWIASIAGLAALAGSVAFVSVYRTGRFGLETTGQDAAVASLIILAMNYFLTFMHELAHASALVHFGRRVKSAGFMIYFGSPAFFVEASDGLMMERGQRIVQAFAGPYAELIIAGAASLFAWAFPDSPVAGLLYKFALLNYFVIFLNLVPFLELDGYWIVSDLIQVPDLRPRSLQFIRYEMWRKLRSFERFTKQEAGLALYGIFGSLFTIFALYTSVFFWREIFGGLVSKLWGGGTISRVLLLALALFVTGPILRGLIGLLRSLLRKGKALAAAIRFRMETTWRVEAAKLVDSIPMFEDLPEDVLSDLAGRARLRSVPPGKPVIRQGERPEAFYVVRRGTLHVVEEDLETGKERVLRTLGRGESFGELGLVDGALRTATVRSVEESQVFEFDKGTFGRLLAEMIHMPEFAPSLQRMAELRELPPFASLGSEDLSEVSEHGEWVNIAPGEVIIEQGEVGDAFYVIRSGQVDIVEDGEAGATLGPGSHFGEIALLMDVPRTASVIARTPVKVFRVDREGFDRVVANAFRKGTLDPTVAIDRTWQH